MSGDALMLLLSIGVWIASLKIQDRSHKTLLEAERIREEAATLYAQAIARNDEAITAQTEAHRMLEATRAIVQEHNR